MTTLPVSLSDEQTKRLAEVAGRLGIDLPEVVRRSVNDFLERERAFDEAAEYVLDKNSELYWRLAQ